MRLEISTEECLALVKIIIPAQQQRKSKPLSEVDQKEVEAVDAVLHRMFQEVKFQDFIQQTKQPGLHFFEG